ncbi:MAG: MBL fold metallo-hydrolase [Nevskiaceae bacterium]|nr:MAG: MBL fold metallo-hydrolase [Nevskiaceae bacterium]
MKLPAFRDLPHGITCIDTEQHRQGMAACYLIQHQGAAAFVECGTTHSVPSLLALLDKKNIAREQVAYVIPTHVHLDHAGGAGALMQALPQARLVVHPRGARHMIDPTQLLAGATAVYGAAAVQKMYGELVPVPEARVIAADDGHKLSLNGRTLEFIHTPGHAQHHFSVWDATSKGFFTGDTFGLSYREFDGPDGPWICPTTTPVQFDPQAWERTLDRYLSYSPQRMYLTHYGAVEGVPALAEELRKGLREYVRIAESLASAPRRHLQIKDALMKLALHELADRDCELPELRCRMLLEADMELNAQGLGVWLDKQRKAA